MYDNRAMTEANFVVKCVSTFHRVHDPFQCTIKYPNISCSSLRNRFSLWSVHFIANFFVGKYISQPDQFDLLKNAVDAEKYAVYRLITEKLLLLLLGTAKYL